MKYFGQKFLSILYKIVKRPNTILLDEKMADDPLNSYYADPEYYVPTYSPWLTGANPEFSELIAQIQGRTLVSADRCYILYSFAKQALQLGGFFYECGVYKGGTARLIAEVISRYSTESKTRLLLFDTFEGMPNTHDQFDWHNKGDFSDADIENVGEFLVGMNFIELIKGYIPVTFSNRLEDNVSFAHIDVDIYQSVIDCCEFIYPRMVSGGVFIFDDYGFKTCPGARRAVDEFFSYKPEVPIVLPTGQAIVVKI